MGSRVPDYGNSKSADQKTLNNSNNKTMSLNEAKRTSVTTRRPSMPSRRSSVPIGRASTLVGSPMPASRVYNTRRNSGYNPSNTRRISVYGSRASKQNLLATVHDSSKQRHEPERHECAELRQSQVDMDKLQLQYAEEQKQKQELAASVASLSTSHAGDTAQLRQSATQLEKLQQEMKQKMVDIDKQTRTINVLEDRIRQLEVKASEVDQAEIALENMKRTLENSQFQCAKVERELRSLNDEHHNVLKNLQSRKEDELLLKDRIDDLKCQVREEIGRNVKLEKMIDSVPLLKDELSACQEKLTETEQELQRTLLLFTAAKNTNKKYREQIRQFELTENYTFEQQQQQSHSQDAAVASEYDQHASVRDLTVTNYSEQKVKRPVSAHTALVPAKRSEKMMNNDPVNRPKSSMTVRNRTADSLLYNIVLSPRQDDTYRHPTPLSDPLINGDDSDTGSDESSEEREQNSSHQNTSHHHSHNYNSFSNSLKYKSRDERLKACKSKMCIMARIIDERLSDLEFSFIPSDGGIHVLDELFSVFVNIGDRVMVKFNPHKSKRRRDPMIHGRYGNKRAGSPLIALYTGMIQYLGYFDSASPSSVLYVGVKLDEPVGNCDGTRKGRQFMYTPPKYGRFIKATNVISVFDVKSAQYVDVAALIKHGRMRLA